MRLKWPQGSIVPLPAKVKTGEDVHEIINAVLRDAEVPMPPECEECGALLGTPRTIDIVYKTYTLSVPARKRIYCGRCKPPYDKVIESVEGDRYFKDGVEEEVTREGKKVTERGK